MQTIYQQFVHPTGWLGRIIGFVMLFENRERIQWAIDSLTLNSGDSMLEIGFGPGLAIDYLAQKPDVSFVAGVDHSDIMLNQASNRNGKAIQQGKVALKHGSAESIPFGSRLFDTVFAINSYHLWQDQGSAFDEIQRVLKPDGRLAIFEQPPERVKEQIAMKRRAEQIAHQMMDVGFTDVIAQVADLKRGWAASVTGAYKAD